MRGPVVWVPGAAGHPMAQRQNVIRNKEETSEIRLRSLSPAPQTRLIWIPAHSFAYQMLAEELDHFTLIRDTAALVVTPG